MSSPVQFSRYTSISSRVTRLSVLLSLNVIKPVVKMHAIHCAQQCSVGIESSGNKPMTKMETCSYFLSFRFL